MNQRMQVFKCEKCGNIVEILHGGPAPLNCCGAPMKAMVEGAVDAAKEKHVPVIEKVTGGFKVKVGSVTHPMEDKHYIEWIEVIAGDKIYREFLKPGQPPEAFFPIDPQSAPLVAREYCNLHGLWKKEN